MKEKGQRLRCTNTSLECLQCPWSPFQCAPSLHNMRLLLPFYAEGATKLRGKQLAVRFRSALTFRVLQNRAL